jgi:CubicO group peptidase (beta-lactamase class C family)
MKTVVVILVILAGTTADALAQSNGLTTTAETLEQVRSKYDLPGLAVVVVRRGQIVDRAAVGVRKTGNAARLTTNDVFHIGSCTKSMTATLAARLIEVGRLRWDSTVGEVFAESHDRIHYAWEAVTIEQLLTHRGGAPAEPPANAWREAWQDEGTVVQQRFRFAMAILAAPPRVSPGTQTIYSNQGYAIAGAMVEKVVGQSWETLMREHLFQPLGMASAGFGPPGKPGEIDQPWGHARSDKRLVPDQQDNPPAIGPAGTVHCSLDDLARFVKVHLGSSEAMMLPKETLHRLHTPPSESDYAFGWVSTRRSWAGGSALTHAGSNTRWFVVMWLAPAKQSAVIVGTNYAGPDDGRSCDEVASAMIRKWFPD